MNTNALRVFRQYLKDRDLRMTSERLRIAMKIAAIDAPVSADDVRDWLPKVSRATIYRTLNLLVDAGVLEQSISSNGAQVFFAASPCAEGTVFTPSKPAKQMQKYEQLCAASHTAVIVGTCPWCGAAIIPSNASVDSTK